LSFVFDLFSGGVGQKAAREQAKSHQLEAANARVAAEAEASQLETRARQGVAVGSYNSDRIAKRAKEIMSSQRAAAAAGGGDTTDATVQAITDEAIREASMEQKLVMAEAEDRARQDRYGAAVRRVTGKQQSDASMNRSKAAKLGGYATLLSTAGKAVESASWAKTFGG
jgi:hypothetical protein